MDPRLLIRPPILLQSAALPPVPAHSDHGTGRIRVLATIHINGRMDATSDLAGASLDRELIGALQTWQFSPATRNGVPFEADAVIEIPVAFGTISLR
jgi:TonB family protein